MNDATDNSAVKTRIEDSILEVTLDRPKANAVDLATSRELGQVFADFRDNHDLRVAIITGAGEKFFCPGWDLKAADAGDEVDGDYGVGGFGGMQELPRLNKPIICAVNGICCGGGLEIALSTDIIIAAEHASFALPEINSGTVADAASIKLPKRIPYHIAMQMLLTGRWLDAEEAHRWGFVNEIVAADELMNRAWETARLIAAGPPLVMAAIKEIVRDAEDSKFQDALNRVTQRQLQTVDTLYGSDDMREGFKAFAEKREPVWKGK
ncbi:MAG: crotonobetainyl-CoA hydratase [Arenicella sp.]|jgi:crotonobetainyl-CoA hydratase